MRQEQRSIHRNLYNHCRSLLPTCYPEHNSNIISKIEITSCVCSDKMVIDSILALSMWLLVDAHRSPAPTREVPNVSGELNQIGTVRVTKFGDILVLSKII